MTASPEPVRSPSGLALGARAQVGPFAASWQRRTAIWRMSRRALEQCSGARAGLWLARSSALFFVLSSFYAALPLGEALDAIVRVACVNFSWCAGLAALSSAGPAHLAKLEDLSGLFALRGLRMDRVRAEAWVGLVTWTWRHMTPLAAAVVASTAIAPEPWRFGQFLGLSVGVIVYFFALGLGLALLARVCQALTRARGRSLLFAIVFVPELLSPAWPELPTVPGLYSSVLDACLAPGVRW